VLTLFLVFGIAFEVPMAVVVLARIGMVTIEQLKQGARLLHRRRLHRRRGGDAARRDLAAVAGDPDVHPVRAGHPAARRFIKQTKAPGRRRGREADA
jgi:hypothetical protein